MKNQSASHFKRHYQYILKVIFAFLALWIIYVLGFEMMDRRLYIKELNFYDQSVMFYPNALKDPKVSYEKINDTFSDYQYVTHQATVDLDSQYRQAFSFIGITKDFIHTGVSSYQYKRRQTTIEKVHLLYGSIWTDDHATKKIVVDEQTAQLMFDKSNAVGKTLVIQQETFDIIGVVSNTQQRASLAQRVKQSNPKVQESDLKTNVYIPYFKAKSMSDDFFTNEVIIADSRYTGRSLSNILSNEQMLQDIGLVDRNKAIKMYQKDTDLYHQIGYMVMMATITCLLLNALSIHTIIENYILKLYFKKDFDSLTLSQSTIKRRQNLI